MLPFKYDPKTKVVSGFRTESMYHPDVSVGLALFNALKPYPKNVIQINDPDGVELTNQQILTMGAIVGKRFRMMEIEQDDIIGFVASNTTKLFPVILGAIFEGIPINALDPILDHNTIVHILGLTRPKLIFCDGNAYEKVKNAIGKIGLKSKIVTLKDHIDDVPTVEDFLVPSGGEMLYMPAKLKYGGDHSIAIVCSSGTTGLPKGVKISHKSILRTIGMQQVTNETVTLCLSSMYVISGLIFLVHGLACGVKRVITDKQFTPEYYLKLIEKHNVTLCLAPPSIITRVVNCPAFESSDLSSIEAFSTSGSAVAQAISIKLLERMPKGGMAFSYAMTETVGLGALSFNRAKPTSVGKPHPNTEIKVIDPNGNSLGIGEKGEICIRTDTPFGGYYKNPQATAELCDIDGWIHSGDIGYYDKDFDLYITGRIKEIFKCNGTHVFPAELENIILQKSGVSDVCVFGVPDETFNLLPAAAVVKSAGSNITKNEIFDHVAANVSEYKKLRGGVFFLEFLPRTVFGKSLRDDIRDMCKKL